jgi:hypothetical protein
LANLSAYFARQLFGSIAAGEDDAVLDAMGEEETPADDAGEDPAGEALRDDDGSGKESSGPDSLWNAMLVR